jgi:protein phosphatase
MIDAHGVTHPGRVRTINEDALLADEALRLFVVADGMGGHNAGDVASRIAVETVRAFLVRSQDQAECTWPYGIDSRVSLDANRLLTALKVANRKVFRAADAAVLAGDDSLCFGSVGDSRVYAHSAGTLARLTEDDSWLASIAAADATLTEEQKATHPMRHVLTKALGATPTVDVDVTERAVRAGEQFLLCSDGLHGAIEHSAIGAVLSSAASAREAAERLVQAALDGPASDNVTALVVRYCE